jgi:hypothetical protein
MLFGSHVWTECRGNMAREKITARNQGPKHKLHRAQSFAMHGMPYQGRGDKSELVPLSTCHAVPLSTCHVVAAAALWCSGLAPPVRLPKVAGAGRPHGRGPPQPSGRFLIRPCDLVGAPMGRTGLFFCLPGRGGHLGGPTTKWGGRGRPSGHAAVPPAVRRWPLPLAGPRGPFFFPGGFPQR